MSKIDNDSAVKALKKVYEGLSTDPNADAGTVETVKAALNSAEPFGVMYYDKFAKWPLAEDIKKYEKIHKAAEDAEANLNHYREFRDKELVKGNSDELWQYEANMRMNQSKLDYLREYMTSLFEKEVTAKKEKAETASTKKKKAPASSFSNTFG